MVTAVAILTVRCISKFSILIMVNLMRGVVSKLYHKRKFGFIKYDDGKEVFFHFNDVNKQYVPAVGDNVVFKIGKDRFNRKFAHNIHFSEV